MASYNQPMPGPIRTNTANSTTSQSSGQLSPPCSPASSTSPSAVSESFFGALTSRIRGRSRSHSRGAVSRKRSKSPMVLPQSQAPPSRNIQFASPTRPSAAPVQTPGIQDVGRRSTSGSDPWRGRHSNDWLFNGYSVTASAKEFIQKRKP
ncbi:hypothetical protein ACN47E_004466 [Coniothyrium glycines]